MHLTTRLGGLIVKFDTKVHNDSKVCMYMYVCAQHNALVHTHKCCAVVHFGIALYTNSTGQ